tara:strand:+ start:1325 stop:1861 length:537 start_codon:yes stop_codon:yes gene_type:complete
MKIKRKLHRASFYVLKYLIGLFVYLDHRIYMKLYNRLLNLTGLKINGIPRFIAKSVKFDNFDLIELGDNLVVSSNVIFLSHDYSYTTALISIDEKPETDVCLLGKIIVGNNVFIGMNVMLLPGVTIGNNVIIGAGSIVRGSIPDDSIVSGNPAKVVKDIKEHAYNVKTKNYMKSIDSK